MIGIVPTDIDTITTAEILFGGPDCHLCLTLAGGKYL